MRVERIDRDQGVEIEQPLLATYVFVLISREWRPIFQIDSALGLFRSSAEAAPSAVADAVMGALGERER